MAAAKVTTSMSLPSGGTVDIMSDTTAVVKKGAMQVSLTHADLGAIGKSSLGKTARKR